MIDLRTLPENVRTSAIAMAEAEGETLVGWKAITTADPADGARSLVSRYMVITDKGYYEVASDGIFLRAGVLHSF